MFNDLENWKRQLKSMITDLKKQVSLNHQSLLVIGCSTSEVLGEKIGTAGTIEVGSMIFHEFKKLQLETGVRLAYQCCEHLNRALVVEKQTALQHNFEMVTVTPVQTAGGAMATYAYENMADAVVVEFVKADAGIDIGDTFIGMHLKHVAVPIRGAIRQVGNAHVTMASTRPKLIGGERAVYKDKPENNSC